ncbi:response regulator with GGDEF domain [gamma proteobacterium HdN1]|nr:response regulator with GGDEF domain [gamma proteobacterium HdN1]
MKNAMPNMDLPIMLVDDARFSGAVIGRALQSAGYKDVRTTNSAKNAIAQLEQRPVSVLIADWLMPEMDGLELAERVRQQDEATNHFTYIILLTAKEGHKALVHAFDHGVDDFINKSAMNEQLLPRIYAADRLASMQNRLLRENQLLIEANQHLKKISLVDLLTGLGNLNYTTDRLEATLTQADSRGGAACYLVIRIDNYSSLKERFDRTVLRETVVAIARRLRQLVRPLDHVSRIGINEFAIITHQPDISQANSSTYRRIYDALNVKAVKTSAGFISIKAAMCMIAANQETGFPTPQRIMSATRSQLEAARSTGRLLVIKWKATPPTPNEAAICGDAPEDDE